MCHPPRLCIVLLTTYVTVVTALLDGAGRLDRPYLSIDHRASQPLTPNMRNPQVEELMASYNDGFPDHLSQAEQHTPADLEDLTMALLADKLQGAEPVGGPLDPQRPTTLEDVDFEEFMDAISQEDEPDSKTRLTREAFDFRKPDDPIEMSEQGMLLVNCRSGRLDWPPCTLFSTDDTGPFHTAKEVNPLGEEFDEESQDTGEKPTHPGEGETGQEVSTTRRKRETGTLVVNEIKRSARQATQSNVLPSKMRKGFSSWGGKRVPPFGSWGGKRDPDFHSWGGKRARDGVKTLKKQPIGWEGKRVPAFHSWGGKRAPSFNSWGGKRAPSFNSWGGKRAPAFTSWGGKREPFNSWGGKRATFNSWGGKRAYEGDYVDENNEDISEHPLINPMNLNELESELENGKLNPWMTKWAVPMPQFGKENAAAVVSKNKPPEK